MEKGFSYLHDGGKIFWDIRYSTSNNITGSPLPGYDKNIPIGTIQLKEALKKAVDIAESEGLYLFLFDAYRPQKAVDRLVAWAKEEENNQTKTMFYPNVEKKIMIKKGYIAERSGHSRGSVIDLTLANRKKELLYMGTNFDFMDEKSHHDNVDISTEGRKNRKKLKDIMERSGFVAYEKEWWHYRLSGEPYQNNYFNFDIK